MSNFNCTHNCCSYKLTHWSKPKTTSPLPPRPSNRRKAGVLLHDPTTNKVLLVQSCGKLWGPPKGSVEPDESYDVCAARELREETGLTIPEEAYTRPVYVKSNAVYFYHRTTETPVVVQTSGSYNDANGIGWFRVECVKRMVKEGKMAPNQHLKLTFKKFLDIDLS